jgi:uncharacterized protein YraI
MNGYVLPLAAAALAVAAIPGVAAAQDRAVVTTEVNMRAGPSTGFPVVEVIPENGRVTVFGCLTEYEWCDVAWRGARGWVDGDYLRYYYGTSYVPLIEYGPRIGVPIIVFSFDSYWDSHYRRKSWYRQRVHWHHFWRRHDRRDDRADRRDERRDDRADRRDERRDDSVQRRDDRRDKRADRRDETDRAKDRRVVERPQQRESRAERQTEQRVIRSERGDSRRQVQVERSSRQPQLRSRESRVERSFSRSSGGSNRAVERRSSGRDSDRRR